jgi:hypothetical protein
MAEKAPGIEHIGSIPQQAMPMQYIGRDDQQRSRSDRLSVQIVAVEGDAAYRGNRWI